MQIKFDFRKMSERDLEWFLSIRNAVRLNLHNSNEFTLTEATEWWRSNSLEYWVIEVAGQKIGYFRVIELSLTKILIGSDIDPDFHGRGYGYISYLQFAQEVLLPRGIKELELRVLKNNLKAIGLYKKLGFQKVNETEEDYLMCNNVESILKQRKS